MKRKFLGLILALCLLIPQVVLAGSLSNSGETKSLEHIMKKTAWTPTHVCVALYCGTDSGGTAPSETAAGTEVSTGSYARVDASSLFASSASAGDPSSISNSSAVTYPQSSAAYCTGSHNVNYFGVYDCTNADCVTGCTYIGYGTLTAPLTVNASGITPSFAATTLSMTCE